MYSGLNFEKTPGVTSDNATAVRGKFKSPAGGGTSPAKFGGFPPILLNFRLTTRISSERAEKTLRELQNKEKIESADRASGQQVINQRHQRLTVDGFPEESICTPVQIEGFPVCRWLSGNNDYRDLAMRASEMLEEFQSSHLPHLDICDYAIALGESARCEEQIGRRVCLRLVPVRCQKILK